MVPVDRTLVKKSVLPKGTILIWSVFFLSTQSIYLF